MATMQKAQPETVALFVSDVHLSPERPKTTQAFFDFLQRRATGVRQLYLLGDLFEAWAGDDSLSDPWNAAIARAIRSVAEAGIDVFWIGGNRDLLVGDAFARAAGLTRLPERVVTELAGRRIALAHGDALCTGDASYMRFRAWTHRPFVQRLFLTLPLSWRQKLVALLRDQSDQSKQAKPAAMTDVHPAAIDALFNDTGASVLIHGHTHRPDRHDSADGKRSRYVLPDWDCECKPERGGWVALFADGTLRRFDIKGRMVTNYPPQELPYSR